MPVIEIPYRPRRWAVPMHASWLRWFVTVLHRRAGKAQPLSAHVLTPSGFVQMGTLRVGQTVVTPSGRQARITGVFPQGDHPTFRVTMADGASTLATADHLWKVSYANRRRKDQVASTASLQAFLARERGRAQRNKSRPLLDMITPAVEFGHQASLPLDPYVLGLLLGDGGLSDRSNVRFSSMDAELITALRDSGLRAEAVSKSRCDYHVYGANAAVRALGLVGMKSATKFLPSVYMGAARSVRLAVLQGLLDTDGSTDGSRIEYCSVSLALATQAAYLARSLGWMATVRDGGLPSYTYRGQHRVGQRRYRVHIRAAQGAMPFRLARKAAGFSGYRFAQSRHAIVSIEATGQIEACQCLAISDPDQLYVTDDFIVTHNTTSWLNHHQRAAMNNTWETTRLRTLEPSFTDTEIRELLRERIYAHILPTLTQARTVAWDKLKYISRDVAGAKPNESDMSIKYPCPRGSVHMVRLFGADNIDALRGFPLSGLSLDEYSQHPPGIFGEVLSKSLADHLGYAAFLGTIKGKNQLYQAYEQSKADPQWFTLWQDVSVTLASEEGAAVKAIRRAMQDDLNLITNGLMTQEEYDQEWFLSPHAAIKGAYYSKVLATAYREKRIRAVPYDPALPVYDVWDLGKGPKMSVGMFQRFGRQMSMIDYHEGQESDGIPDVIVALKQKPYVWGKHFAPHDIRSTDLSTGKTRYETAEKLGWKFEVVKDIGVDDGISAGRLLFARLWIDEQHCALFLEAVGQYRREWKESTGQFGDHPVHDYSSHPCDMYRYAAVAEDQMVVDTLSVRKRERHVRGRFEGRRSGEKSASSSLAWMKVIWLPLFLAGATLWPCA